MACVFFVYKIFRNTGLNINIKKLCSKSNTTIMKYLNVAEKNDAAKNIAAILSRGSSNMVI